MQCPLSRFQGLDAPHLKARVKRTGIVHTATRRDDQRQMILWISATQSLFKNWKTEIFARLKLRMYKRSDEYRSWRSPTLVDLMERGIGVATFSTVIKLAGEISDWSFPKPLWVPEKITADWAIARAFTISRWVSNKRYRYANPTKATDTIPSSHCNDRSMW